MFEGCAALQGQGLGTSQLGLCRIELTHFSVVGQARPGVPPAWPFCAAITPRLAGPLLPPAPPVEPYFLADGTDVAGAGPVGFTVLVLAVEATPCG